MWGAGPSIDFISLGGWPKLLISLASLTQWVPRPFDCAQGRLSREGREKWGTRGLGSWVDLVDCIEGAAVVGSLGALSALLRMTRMGRASKDQRRRVAHSSLILA
jgi:hypothetical protein